MEINFQVQGSGAEPYAVTFARDEQGFTATCNCSAGGFGQACKHRIAILEGDVSSIVSGNTSEVATVVSWLAGSAVAVALDELQKAEQAVELAKKGVTAAKKRLSKALLGG